MVIPDASKVLSKAVFGNAYWLPVAAAIATFSDGRFTQRVIAARLGIADNLVRAVLERMKKGDLVKRRDDEWERTPSPVWGFAKALYEEFL